MVDEKRPGGRFLFLVIGDKNQNLAVRTTKVTDGTTKPADRSPKLTDSLPQSLPLHNKPPQKYKIPQQIPLI